MQVFVDDTAIRRLERELAALPRDLQHKVAARAMKRVAGKGTSLIVKDIAELVRIRQKDVRSRTKTSYGVADLSLDTRINSNFIPLIQLGRKRMEATMRKTRGSYRAAFVATIRQNEGVFRRKGKERGPVEELYGPNPAHAVLEKPDRYEDLLAQAIDSILVPRILHEIDLVLGRLGR